MNFREENAGEENATCSEVNIDEILFAKRLPMSADGDEAKMLRVFCGQMEGGPQPCQIGTDATDKQTEGTFPPRTISMITLPRTVPSSASFLSKNDDDDDGHGRGVQLMKKLSMTDLSQRIGNRRSKNDSEESGSNLTNAAVSSVATDQQQQQISNKVNTCRSRGSNQQD